MITEAEIDPLVREFRDPALGRVLVPREDWTLVRNGSLISLRHRYGARADTGAQYRVWWLHDHQGRLVRGPRGGGRDFRYPSRAIRALQQEGHLGTGPTF